MALHPDPAPVPVPAAPKRAFPCNLSEPIPCPVPGYEGVAVRFVVSRSRKQLFAVQGNDEAPLLALLVGAVEGWPFAGDPPQAGDPASFAECEGWGNDLSAWCLRKGYPAALESIINPN